MSYEPNYVPSRRWFCGRNFLEQPKEVIDEGVIKVSDGTLGVKILCKLFLARLNVIRGIRTVFLLSPDNNNDINEMITDLKSKVNTELYEKIYKTYNADFFVSYGGIGQYGIANYQFEDKYGNIERALKNEKCILINQAIKERYENLRQLFKIAEDIFFDIYLEDKSAELFAYGFLDHYGIEEMYDILISSHIANSKEEIVEKYGNDSYELYEKFQKLFDEFNLEIIRTDIYGGILWEEENSIFYEHSS
jgi:hypothetical protein